MAMTKTKARSNAELAGSQKAGQERSLMRELMDKAGASILLTSVGYYNAVMREVSTQAPLRPTPKPYQPTKEEQEERMRFIKAQRNRGARFWEARMAWDKIQMAERNKKWEESEESHRPSIGDPYRALREDLASMIDAMLMHDVLGAVIKAEFLMRTFGTDVGERYGISVTHYPTSAQSWHVSTANETLALNYILLKDPKSGTIRFHVKEGKIVVCNEDELRGWRGRIAASGTHRQEQYNEVQLPGPRINLQSSLFVADPYKQLREDLIGVAYAMLERDDKLKHDVNKVLLKVKELLQHHGLEVMHKYGIDIQGGDVVSKDPATGHVRFKTENGQVVVCDYTALMNWSNALIVSNPNGEPEQWARGNRRKPEDAPHLQNMATRSIENMVAGMRSGNANKIFDEVESFSDGMWKNKYYGARAQIGITLHNGGIVGGITYFFKTTSGELVLELRRGVIVSIKADKIETWRSEALDSLKSLFEPQTEPQPGQTVSPR